MNKITQLILFSFMMLIFFSCQKDDKKVISESQINKEIVVDKLMVPESEFGVGCVTEYYNKDTDNKEMIYLQTSAKEELTWANYISINGKREVFPSKNEDTKSTDDENGFTLRLENDDYVIEIVAKIGEQNIESDSALANGTITIIRKSDHQTKKIDFVGGTSC